MPRDGVDGWVERTRWVGRREERWYERAKPGCPGTIERVYAEAIAGQQVRLAAVAPVEVLLSERARRSILRAAAWQSGVDGLESGGWLIGGGLDSSVVVTDATRPGAAAERGRASFVDDLRAMARFDLRRLWGDPLAARVGSWHSHPAGSAEPSAGDLESWQAGLRAANYRGWKPYYAGIIATRAADRRWRLHAWVARLGEEGETLIEPGEIGDLRARAAEGNRARPSPSGGGDGRGQPCRTGSAPAGEWPRDSRAPVAVPVVFLA